MNDLLKKQDVLQTEALRQVKMLRLEELMSPFGDVYLVGSIVTGLMTWPDVDAEVICETLPTKGQVADFSKELYKQEGMFRVWMMDNREKIDPHQPRGIYAGGKRLVDGEVWKFDIWFMKKGDQESGKDHMQWINDSLTPENRLVILQIKEQIASNPKYRKEIFSVDIYHAVFDENIKDLEGFKEYLKKSDRSL